MADQILYTIPSVMTRSKWITDITNIDPRANLPQFFDSVEGWILIVDKLLESCTKPEMEQIARQCEVVGMNDYASLIRMSIPDVNKPSDMILNEQKEMYNESQK